MCVCVCVNNSTLFSNSLSDTTPRNKDIDICYNDFLHTLLLLNIPQNLGFVNSFPS